MSTGPVAIRLDGLSRDFGSRRAVSGLTLDVPRGLIFGFLGPNGAGKTTTINLLLGLLEPTGGRAEVLGRDPWQDGEGVRRQIGAVLEHTGIYEHLSVFDNLDFFGRAWRMAADERRSRTRELLDAADLWDRRGDKAGSLSSGMQQRLALARAQVHRPPLLFLDEPTAGLDVMAANAVRADLAELPQRHGTTVFLTTHNMAEAERLCSLVAVIRAGRLLALGSPAELRAQPGSQHVEIVGRGFDERVVAALEARPDVIRLAASDAQLDVQLDGLADTAPLISLLVGMGASVSEVRRGQASLEEVFMTLMEEDR